ncbi:MAG: serine/threonine protein kinase [Sandaracinaceae bacterium]|nr:serine/threonine protein kinase [Sandaracinaceae bacterium]
MSPRQMTMAPKVSSHGGIEKPRFMADPSPKTSSNTDTLIGRVINDRFEIIDLIARGGMGRVYRAQQRPLGRQVALKILDPRYKGDEDPEFQTRFFLEASTAAKLSHPNTVTVFDYGKTTDEIYFIVMELVEGRTLSALLKELGPIEPERAINIAVQIARSVREAHGLGVIHRDLKPANVLLTRHGDEEDFVKVLDFGLVKDVEANEELTQAGLFMGSPKYMSPEQIQGGDVDARTDIYALGVMLYLMLCGRVPFDRDNQVQILMAHMREAVPPMVRDDGVAVPAALEAVVMNCLEKDANNRYSDMNELVAALKSASGQMGNPLNTSGNYALSGAFDLSGMRATPGITPNGTPGQGFPSASPSSGFAAASGSLPTLESDNEADSKGGSAKWIVLLLILALGGGAAAAVLSSNQDAVASNTTATPTTPPETPAEPAGTEGTPNAAGATDPEPAAVGEEAPLASVVVDLRSDPPGATVLLGSRALGVTPTQRELVGEDAERGRELTFTFQKSGYDVQNSVRVVTGEPNMLVEVTLQRTQVIRRPTRTPDPTPTMTSTMVDGPSVRPSGYHDSPY